MARRLILGVAALACGVWAYVLLVGWRIGRSLETLGYQGSMAYSAPLLACASIALTALLAYFALRNRWHAVGLVLTLLSLALAVFSLLAQAAGMGG